jgi:hypothetical protein
LTWVGNIYSRIKIGNQSRGLPQGQTSVDGLLETTLRDISLKCFAELSKHSCTNTHQMGGARGVTSEMASFTLLLVISSRTLFPLAPSILTGLYACKDIHHSDSRTLPSMGSGDFETRLNWIDEGILLLSGKHCSSYHHHSFTQRNVSRTGSDPNNYFFGDTFARASNYSFIFLKNNFLLFLAFPGRGRLRLIDKKVNHC